MLISDNQDREMEITSSLKRFDPEDSYRKPLSKAKGTKRKRDDDLTSLVLTKDLSMSDRGKRKLRNHLAQAAEVWVETGSSDRTSLVNHYISCKLDERKKITVKMKDEEDIIHPSIKTIVRAALEAAAEKDGDDAIGLYTGRYSVRRHHGKYNENPDSLDYPMHHDYGGTREERVGWGRKRNVPRNKIPEYSFLTVVSDRADEKHGWKGGRLFIQADSTCTRRIPFDSNVPHLEYRYPLNEGILLKNREVRHQVSGLVGDDIKRDLVAVMLYRA